MLADELDGVFWFVLLLIELDQGFGQVVDGSGFFEVLSEIFTFLIELQIKNFSETGSEWIIRKLTELILSLLILDSCLSRQLILNFITGSIFSATENFDDWIEMKFAEMNFQTLLV